MITLDVTEQDIKLAKERTAEFDKTKTYNKFNSYNNYIGILGEMILSKYFSDKAISHTWVGVKDGTMNSPDFIIEGQTFDLKTTYSDSFWFQKPVHNIYIYAHLSKDNKTITFRGWITKEKIQELIDNKTAKTVIRDKRVDYVLEPKYLNDIVVTFKNGQYKIIFK